MPMSSIDDLTRDELIEVIKAQAVFTSGLRRVANVALSHAGHLLQHYAKDIPEDKLRDWHNASIDATALLIHPAPVAAPDIN
jgi:acyl carrier protein phosphodiesterase